MALPVQYFGNSDILYKIFLHGDSNRSQLRIRLQNCANVTLIDVFNQQRDYFELVNEVNLTEATHFVTNILNSDIDCLCALASGIHIVSETWLIRSFETNNHEEELEFPPVRMDTWFGQNLEDTNVANFLRDHRFL